MKSRLFCTNIYFKCGHIAYTDAQGDKDINHNSKIICFPYMASSLPPKTSLFLAASLHSCPGPGGYHHHIGVRPAGPGRDHHNWLGGELLSRLLPQGHQIELATYEHDSIQEYIRQAGNIAISSCDGILARMENLLLTFQTDRAGCISDN